MLRFTQYLSLQQYENAQAMVGIEEDPETRRGMIGMLYDLTFSKCERLPPVFLFDGLARVEASHAALCILHEIYPTCAKEDFPAPPPHPNEVFPPLALSGTALLREAAACGVVKRPNEWLFKQENEDIFPLEAVYLKRLVAVFTRELTNAKVAEILTRSRSFSLALEAWLDLAPFFSPENRVAIVEGCIKSFLESYNDRHETKVYEATTSWMSLFSRREGGDVATALLSRAILENEAYRDDAIQAIIGWYDRKRSASSDDTESCQAEVKRALAALIPSSGSENDARVLERAAQFFLPSSRPARWDNPGWKEEAGALLRELESTRFRGNLVEYLRHATSEGSTNSPRFRMKEYCEFDPNTEKALFDNGVIETIRGSSRKTEIARDLLQAVDEWFDDTSSPNRHSPPSPQHYSTEEEEEDLPSWYHEFIRNETFDAQINS